jgi:glycosyltransferase involved in cell wall biosynthesis
VPLSVAHVSFSASGGAGGVASLLAEEQRHRNIEARLFSVIDRDLRAQPFTAPLQTGAATLDQYIIKHPEFDAPISLLRDKTLGLDWAMLAKFDVIHLHGINGALALTTVAKHLANARLVWTLHDMNPFTGACHFSLGCDGFTRSCQQCPATRELFRPLVVKSLLEKSDAVKKLTRLSLVSPSRWLASEAARSSVFAHKEIRIINNPVGGEFFRDIPRKKTDTEQGNLVMGVIAQNLSDPRKNVAEAHRAFRRLLDRGVSAHLFLIGDGGNEFVGPNVHRLGNLPAERIIRHLDSWDILLNPSQAENAPLTIIEAAARGCPSFVANEGGMSAMVSDLDQGSTYNSETELTDLLDATSKISPSARNKHRDTLASRARTLYAVSSAVDSYLEVYKK